MEQSKEEPQSRGLSWSCTIFFVAFLTIVFLGEALLVQLVTSLPQNLQLGPNSSILVETIPLFMESITVEEIDDANNRPTVYGFYEDPPLDVFTTFSEAYETSLPPNSVKEWTYYLNQGSQINISYSVNSSSSYSLHLIVDEGMGLASRSDQPFFLPRADIHGSGTISEDIRIMSSNYFVAVINSNSEIVQVRFDIKVKAVLYNTTGAYSECNLRQKECSVRFSFFRGNAVLSSPPQKPGTANGKWSIKISYERRRIVYLFGVGGMIFLICLISYVVYIAEA